VLNAIFFAALFSTFFYLVGSPWLLRFTSLSPAPLFLASNLLGAAISLSTSSLVLLFPLNVYFILPLILLIAIVGWALHITRSGLDLKISTIWPLPVLAYLPKIVIPIPAVIYALLGTTNPVSSAFAYRIGPDNFGWALSSRMLSSGESIQNLVDRVQQQLGGVQLFAWIDHSLTPAAARIIDQIPSFTDRVAYQFLVDAHRTGSPGFLGSVSAALGKDQLLSAFNGLVCWSTFILTLVVFYTAKRAGINAMIAAPLAAILSASFAIFSPALEGGYGGMLTLPFFAIALAAVLAKNPKWLEISFATLLLMAAAVSTYVDALVFALPFIVIMILVRVILGELKLVRPTRRQAILGITGAFVAIAPDIFDFLRLTIYPILNPIANGWDQGRFPFLANIFGLSNWLPFGLGQITERSDSDLYVDFALSVVLVLALLFGKLRRNLVLVVGLLVIIYLTYSTYSHPTEINTYNNYRLWKFGPYAALLLSYLVWTSFAQLNVRVIWANRSRDIKSLIQPALASIVVISSLVSAFIWSSDWQSSKIAFMPQESWKTISLTESKYDIIVDPKFSVLEWAYLGDLHYGLSARGGKAMRSNPERPLVIVKPLGDVCNFSCAQRATGTRSVTVTKLGENKWFAQYLVQGGRFNSGDRPMRAE
jgi:hypothetical protein